MREGVVAVHHHGGQDGLHIVPEPPLHLLALLAIQLPGGQVADVAGPQPLLQLGDDLVLLLVQTGYRLEDGLELLGGGEAALAVHMGLLGQSHVVDGANPDHEELVQVAGENSGKFQPFEERDALVLGLLQHPLVETQPGQFPLLGIACVDLFMHHGLFPPSRGGADSPPGRRRR